MRQESSNTSHKVDLTRKGFKDRQEQKDSSNNNTNVQGNPGPPQRINAKKNSKHIFFNTGSFVASYADRPSNEDLDSLIEQAEYNMRYDRFDDVYYSNHVEYQDFFDE
ncbi:hypothetical protein RF11_02147 [Thelohanellus kitauei]|uniref:Uncharacterized protein n=1 Tax=Thelohanellus kitauei TaxID=669202 RepID=A0A0C2NDC1_THEKT|nr:hypothetical protein RF11_02147 [Thelohanellus kitauei]